MARTVRGPVCGVNNCPSCLWRRVNGQNLCQYGHIRDNDIEIDDDDDIGSKAGLPGKRIKNIDGLKKSKEDKNVTSNRKYGNEFINLKFKCYQIILAKNTKFILTELNMSKDQAKLYISKIKFLWCKLIQYTIDKKFDHYSYKHIDFSYLNIINYLAIMNLNLPIYLSDFILLTMNKNYYSERAEYCLPRSLRIQIPYSKTTNFHGRTIFNYLRRLNSNFCQDMISKHIIDNNFNELNYFPLLVRTVLFLKLPIKIIQLVKNFIDLNKIEFKFNYFNTDKIHPELKILTILIIISKIYFIKNENLLNDWFNRYLLNDKFNFNNLEFKKKLYRKTSFNNLVNWSNEEIDNFINFYNSNVLPNVDASNIASNSESNDRIKMQIAKSINEIFKFERVDTSFTKTKTKNDNENDNENENNEEKFNEYKNDVIKIYQKRGNSGLLGNGYEINTDTVIAVIIEHIVISYSTSVEMVRAAIWTVHKRHFAS